MLCHSKYHMKSYFLESFCFLLRSFVRGSIQGIGIKNYQLQLIALCVSDLFFLWMVFLFRKKFKHKFFAIFMLLFNLGFLLLDIVLLCYFKNPDYFVYIDYSLFLFVLISILITVYLSLIVSILIDNIY